MGIQLADLEAAAQRYQSFQQAQIAAPIEQVVQERLKLGVTNAHKFTSKSDRLGVLANAAFKARLAEPPVPDAPPAQLPPLLAADVAGQEIAFGDNDLRPIRYLHIALLAARAVGKITVRGVVDEEGDATGFLVAPGLLLTNWHVLKSVDYAVASFVSFDYEDGLDGKPRTPKLFDLNPNELFVADQDLDYAFVAVAPATGQGEPLADFGYLRLFEETGKVDPNRRQAANILQHPLGQGKKIAIRDNYFMEPPKDRIAGSADQNSLYYGSDTLRGSSGSPVCTDEWFVVALHRGGVPKVTVVDGKPTVMRKDGTPARQGDSRASIDYVTNEGTRVSRIFASLKDKAAAPGVDAAPAQAILARIRAVARDPLTGPVQMPTAVLGIPQPLSDASGSTEEKLVRRPQAFFAGAAGYDPHFLGEGFEVPLAQMSYEVGRATAPLIDSDERELRYRNYSVFMHARRRTAIFAAANVDGQLLWKNVMDGPMPKRPAWTFDPRMDDKYQPDDAIFSNAMQRGHLFKREDAVQGEDQAQLDLADKHSFVITNATPMIGNFNNVEWGDLEDLVSEHLQAGHKVSYFAGPIFDVEDKFFNELKAGVPLAQRRKGMRVPTSFWKVVAWVEGGLLQAAGFILDQSDEIRAHGPITEEIDFGNYQQTPIAAIEERTGLSFHGLSAVDTYR
ncbi:endonuclease G [Acidovorax soli]|uniref:Serine protease n=1 Tax=Acidovorax soli TaxID=592050 RepID=A0A7X0PHK8_9BURK|nr:DNA/RNA non-specific endonuclease [Acidovorax soli]MBB6562055.1 endonuclease G [Acidovorax soli]